jgi:hypothetical protein
LNDFLKDDITLDSGKVLVLLTEAPTQSFYQWISPIYNIHGAVRKMISTGYHTPDVWKSVIFQILYIFAVLQRGKILFYNMSLENNFYIKDINTDPNTSGTWVYINDNINYYLPNFGHLVTFDSKYAEIDKFCSPNDIVKNRNNFFKIYSSILFNEEIVNFDEHFIRNFKNVIDPNNFAPTIIKNKNGIAPDESIINLLTNIYNSKETDIKEYIKKYFKDFLHNRI